MNREPDDSVRARIPKLSFTVAVTGHRAIDAPAALTASVARILDVCAAKIDAKLQPLAAAGNPARLLTPLLASADAPDLRFLSALARGADLAGMEAALAAKRWACEAILPFAVDDYAETFEGDTEAIERMRAIASGRIPCLEIADRRWSSLPDTELDKRWRERRYTLLGQFLVRRADLLIAVWNGRPARGLGGTAEVVLQAWRSGVPVLWIDVATLDERSLIPAGESTVPDAIDNPDLYAVPGAEKAIDRAVAQVLVGQPDPAHPDDAAPARDYVEREQLSRWYADGSDKPVEGTHAWAYAWLLWRVQGETDLRKWPFQRLRPVRRWDWSLLAPWRPGWSPVPLWRWFTPWYRLHVIALASWTKAKLQPTPPPRIRAAPAPTEADMARWRADTAQIDACTSADKALMPFFARADAIATRLSHRYRSGYVVIFALAALAVLLAALWLVAEPIKVLLVGAEIGAILLILFIWAELSDRRHWWIRGNNTHQRYIDARFLAESVRGAQPLSWIGFAGRRQINDVEPPETAPAESPSGPRHRGRQHRPRSRLWMPEFANAVMALPPLPAAKVTPQRIGVMTLGLINIVADQQAYHANNQRRLKQLHEALDNAGFWSVMGAALVSTAFVAAAILVAVSHGEMGLLVNLEALEHAGGAGFTRLAHLAALAGSVGPAMAAAMAGIRYHGDFERFAERSRMTGYLLGRLADRGWRLWRRAGDCAPGACPDGPPLFEELYELMLDTQALLDDDLLDWRFAYQARPLPLP